MTASCEPLGGREDGAVLPASDAALSAPASPGLRSFFALLLTQLLGAANDNTFRLLAVGVGVHSVAPEHSSVVLSAGLACFTLPYLLFASVAGYLADRFSKRQVIVACKVAEIAIMAAGVAALASGHLPSIFAVLMLMGTQSALFGPAKLGSIPEMLPVEKISWANGWMGLVTIVATVAGVAAGNTLFQGVGTAGGLAIVALLLLGVAIAGTAASLLIGPLPAAAPAARFPIHPVRETWNDLKKVVSHRPLLRVAGGIAFFWAMGALAQSNILEFGAEGGLLQEQTNPLLAAMVIGVGVGSVLAGVWSGGRVELGILPLGAFGMALSAVMLWTVDGRFIDAEATWTASRVWACFWLLGLGLSAGLFNVPLEAFLQHRSPAAERGSILAASNFITFASILAVAGLYLVLRAPWHETAADRTPTIEQLSPASQQQVRALVDEREQAWDAVPTDVRETPTNLGPQALAASLQTLPAEPQVRAAALRELAAVDLRRRPAVDRAPALRDYRTTFHDSADLEAIRAGLGERAPWLSARQVFLLAGAMTLPILFYILWLIPQASLRFAVWLASRTIYRIRVEGAENLPPHGGALLTPNHVSWLDGILLLITSSRPIRMLAYAPYVSGPGVRSLARLMGVIPIDPSSRASIRQAMQAARQALSRGELVCIFPEGEITRTGELGAFKRGLTSIAEGTGAPIVPVYLDQLWGSIFSFERGRFFWKFPRRWPYPVLIRFGPPAPEGTSAEDVRRRVQSLAQDAWENRMQPLSVPPREFVRNCRRQAGKLKIADSTGQTATGGQLLLRTLVLRRLLRRLVLKDDERFVGLLLPPSLGGAIVNAALPLLGRVAVNLNYTLSQKELDHCLQECGIRHVLTSRRVMEKIDLKINAETVFLEDFKDQVTLTDKLSAAFWAKAAPLGMLLRHLGLDRLQPDDLMTIIFTSGSTNLPKGVMLSMQNVGSNVAAVQEAVHLREEDVVLGTLPFFHSFGYTLTLWTVLTLAPRGVYHFSPLDAKIVGKLCGAHKVTILMTTPTFLRSYAKRCSKEELQTLDVVVAGAEKLPVDIMDVFEEKFGVRPVEGYGATELSPLVAVNVPQHRAVTKEQTVREGSVGRPVPGVEAKVVDPDTYEDRGRNTEGMLLVRGPNVMLGYLNHPEKTSEVLRDGWYVTGDMARIDEQGFIHITGRLSRFSKIGGEMVPHLKVEEEVLRIISSDAEEVRACVTAVPCSKKGERLVVLHLPLDKSPTEICRQLAAAGLPNLFIPSPDSFYQVEAIPLLGTGKLDLKGVKQLAQELAAKESPPAA